MSGPLIAGRQSSCTVEQEAEQITRILTQIQRVLDSREELGALVNFKIMEKGQNERSRYAKLLTYNGPDLTTVNLLEIHRGEWLQNPANFWAQGLSADISGLPQQQARIVGIYLQTTCVDA